VKHTAESKERISIANKGRKLSEETKARMRNFALTSMHHNMKDSTTGRFVKNPVNMSRYERMKNHSHQFTIRISHEDKELLWERAKRKKLSVAELIRTYIEWGFENGNADRVI
jgi:hypothetical protein